MTDGQLHVPIRKDAARPVLSFTAAMAIHCGCDFSRRCYETPIQCDVTTRRCFIIKLQEIYQDIRDSNVTLVYEIGL